MSDGRPELIRPEPRPNLEDVSEHELALIRRCRAGDVEAFGELVERHQDRLFGTLTHFLGSVEDAREVMQDAFTLAFQKLDTFRGDSSFYSWLFRIAYNAAMSRRRKERRQQSASIDAARHARGEEPKDERPGADPTAALDIEERQHLVQRALAELGDEYRTVIVLKEIEGLRYDEIANIIGSPIGTVRSRIHRARRELREKLGRAIRNET